MAPTAHTPLQLRQADALRRVVGVALWASRASRPFSFSELKETLPGAFKGSRCAVERMWSRDKLLLASVGVRIGFEAADVYALDLPTALAPLAPSPAAVALLREIALQQPVAGDGERLELGTGLRKLLASGAPIRAAILASGPLEVDGFEVRRLLSATFALLAILRAAGDAGLSIDEATVLAGFECPEHLEAAVEVLVSLELPGLDPVLDSIPVELGEGRVALYSHIGTFPPLPLTPMEAGVLSVAAERIGTQEAAAALRRAVRRRLGNPASATVPCG